MLVAGRHGARGYTKTTASRLSNAVGRGLRGPGLVLARVVVKERNVVEAVRHAANVVIRTRKARTCSAFIPNLPESSGQIVDEDDKPPAEEGPADALTQT
jgi:hypothetical protein